MIKIAAAVSGAALLAGVIVLLPGMTPMVSAGTSLNTINSQAKGDRLDLGKFGPGCSERGWPYYEASCLRGAGNSPAKPVRIVSTDRLPASIRFATSH
jgi:hypothetical protein